MSPKTKKKKKKINLLLRICYTICPKIITDSKSHAAFVQVFFKFVFLMELKLLFFGGYLMYAQSVFQYEWESLVHINGWLLVFIWPVCDGQMICPGLSHWLLAVGSLWPYMQNYVNKMNG